MTLEEKYHLTKNNKYAKYFSITEAYARRNLSREELVKIWKEENEKMKPYFHRYENPFMKIPHFFDSLVSCFLPGDDIVIQEKIDGSNAHMRISRKDPEKPEFKAYGQNYELNEQNSLDGFYYFVQDHAADIPSKYDGLDIYGEWLIPHSCVYPEEAYGEFYVFDVMEDGNYWTQDRVQKLAQECGLHYAPVFYAGKFQNWHHVMDFVGRTMLGGSQGEGIVLKNQTRLNQPDTTFYTKIVSQEFQEVFAKREKVKPFQLKKVLALAERRELAESVVTRARVQKQIEKLVTEGEISANWKQLEPKDYQSKVTSAVYRDCRKETPEAVEKLGKEFGRLNGLIVSEHLKAIIRDENDSEGAV